MSIDVSGLSVATPHYDDVLGKVDAQEYAPPSLMQLALRIQVVQYGLLNTLLFLGHDPELLELLCHECPSYLKGADL